MKKSIKVILVVSACLVALGIIVTAVAFAIYKFDITSINTLKADEKVYTVDEDFISINVSAGDGDVVFARSADDKCSVTCYENDKISHTVGVNAGTLTIERKNGENTLDSIGTSIGKNRWLIKISLPKDEYSILSVESESGNIKVPGGFKFGEIRVYGDSGEAELSADVQKGVLVQTSSGDVEIKNLSCKDVQVSTASGEIDFDNVKGTALYAMSSSGDISFENAVFDGDITVESSSGEVELEDCDAKNLNIKTASGDVSGNLLTAKTFITDTDSGSVKVPQVSGAKGECKVTTKSGDIIFGEYDD